MHKRRKKETSEQDVLTALLIRHVGYINRTIQLGEKHQFFINKSVVMGK